LPKEKLAGKFAAGWVEALKESGLEQSDITSGLADVLAVKSKEQLDATRKGGELVVQVHTRPAWYSLVFACPARQPGCGAGMEHPSHSYPEHSGF